MNVVSRVPAIDRIAAAIGDPARAEVLTALLADRALTATELATVAGVGKSTISSHLEKLLRTGLVAVDAQGRHKYFRLSDPDVGRALESLMGIAWRTGAVRPPGPADPGLRRARVCYDHLAGELGVFVYESLLRGGGIAPRSDSSTGSAEWDLTASGERLFRSLGVEIATLRSQRRAFCRSCLDWSERRHHLAGAVGAALLGRITRLKWARPVKGSRVLVFSRLGEDALRRAFDTRRLARPG
jgi:DNA-binding transcriptional ArsR family regulator